ncbi:MAG: hypothetical protein IKO97_06695, partial [Erysipelotrichaceae bacterium]|nr:hypothetical protein [Erysipelotrichaceae bacterium]
MLLSQIFKGAPDIEIEQLSIDSRHSMKNAIFFCLDGIKYDGHDYIEEAISNGAKVIVYSKEQKEKFKAIYIKVSNVNSILTKAATLFYNDPNAGIDKYVIIGNYGRSSVASFINDYLNSVSSCGYIGILGIRYNGLELNSSFATLNILDNLKMLDTMKKSNVKACTFEADAASLNLQKLDSIKPEVVIYTCTNKNSSEYQTNDYYTYMRRYLYTLENSTKVLFNVDDESFKELSDCVDNYVTYGTSTIADFQIRDVTISTNGIAYKIVSTPSGKINLVETYKTDLGAETGTVLSTTELNDLFTGDKASVTFSYKVEENVPANKLPGVTYTSVFYTVTVVVTYDKSRGELSFVKTIEKNDGTKVTEVETIEFVNTYAANGQIDIEGDKKLADDSTVEAGKYSFTLYKADGTTEIDTITNTAGGNIDFSALKYALTTDENGDILLTESYNDQQLD